MLINWLLYPLLLTLASAGHGLLVRRVLRGPSDLLLLPAGFASMIVVTTALMRTGLHGAAWLGIVVPAVAGLAARARARTSRRPTHGLANGTFAWSSAARAGWLWPAAAAAGA